MMRFLLFAVCFLLIANLTGCATVVENAKGIAGRSTKTLEEHRKEAISGTFNYAFDTCFEKTEKFLKNSGTYIYAENKNRQMIAVYISEEDTTPVGIFFKAIDPVNTQVEVSSPSTYGRELISKKLFLALETSLKKEKEEGSNVEKDAQYK